MAKIGLPKGSGKRLKVREKSVKSQGISKRILSGKLFDTTKLGFFRVEPHLVLLLFYNGGRKMSKLSDIRSK